MVIGIFPIWGTTTWICLGLAIVLRLNIVILQLVNYLLFPLQLLLIYPFVSAGVSLFQLKFDYTASQFLDVIQTNFWLVVKDSGLALLSGAGVWALCAVPLFFGIFYGSKYVFEKYGKLNQRELKSQ